MRVRFSAIFGVFALSVLVFGFSAAKNGALAGPKYTAGGSGSTRNSGPVAGGSSGNSPSSRGSNQGSAPPSSGAGGCTPQEQAEFERLDKIMHPDTDFSPDNEAEMQEYADMMRRLTQDGSMQRYIELSKRCSGSGQAQDEGVAGIYNAFNNPNQDPIQALRRYQNLGILDQDQLLEMIRSTRYEIGPGVNLNRELDPDIPMGEDPN